MSPGPTRIELPVPFAIKTVNAWLFPGSAPALVDCGVSTSLSYQTLLDGIRAAGVDPATLKLLVTHAHVDHAGNAHRLRKDFGVPLHAHDGERDHLETYKRDSAARNDEFADALRAHGVPEPDVVRLREGSDVVERYIEDVPLAGTLDDGQPITLGDDEAHIIHLPGHTPGSVGFLLSQDNDLLSGDTLLQTITSNAIELRDADHGRFHQYVKTLEAMRRYVGCEALPGHHEPFRVTDEVLDEHLDRHQRRRQKILALLDRPRTAYQVWPELFGHLQDGDGVLFMGMAEVVGHLHSLLEDGQVTMEEEGGIRRFKA